MVRRRGSGRSPADRAGAEPGGYFHLSPGEIYVGGGMWHPETAKLVAFRRAVADDPAGVRRLIDEPRFVATFGHLSGEALKRIPTGFPTDHPEAELLKLKDVTFGHRLSDADAGSAGLPTPSPIRSRSRFP